MLTEERERMPIMLISKMLNEQASLTLCHDFEHAERIYLSIHLEDVIDGSEVNFRPQEFAQHCDSILRKHSSAERFARYSIPQLQLFAVSSDELDCASTWTFYRRYLCQQSRPAHPPAIIAWHNQSRRWLQQ